MGNKCNSLFKPGKLTILMDGGAGSSGKGKVASYLTENADNWSFACNTFAPQAGHWVRLRDGREFFYQTLNSCAYNHEKFERIFLGPGSIIELPSLLREIEANNIPRSKIGISPVVPILDPDIDKAFECGLKGFDGAPALRHDGTAKFGSTCHGVGSNVARRVLRTPSLKLARDIPKLKDMLCDVSGEISDRLTRGQSGLLEIAQGYQLSNMHPYFYPYVTSRNVTVAQGMSDMFLPVRFAGDLVLNFRTFPIRISSNKYIAHDDGRHLTWNEVQSGVPHQVYEGNSGKWYPDQTETTWEEVTAFAGADNLIFEMTSVTKLPRRVATFSLMNVKDAIANNDTGNGIHLSINFANYVDHGMTGETARITEKFSDWMRANLQDWSCLVRFVGTGAYTEDMVMV